MKDHSHLRIATRKSPLALWQTHFIQQQLQQQYPALKIELVEITTTGDTIHDKPLADIGGKALFVKALEQALLDDQADIAVHSLKDMPADLESEFTIAAVSARANPFDALLSRDYADLDTLPQGAKVGTSSPRRKAQLLAYRADLNIALLRGNVDTRVKKCLAGEYDAIILACAGLERLGLQDHIRQVIPDMIMLPAAGQGVIGVECLSQRTDLIELLNPLNHAETHATMIAERALVMALQGNCHSAIGAFAHVYQQMLHLTGIVAAADGSSVIRTRQQGLLQDPAPIGRRAAEALLKQGACDLLNLN
jgi:hydroxymethylbilane synthase